MHYPIELKLMVKKVAAAEGKYFGVGLEDAKSFLQGRLIETRNGLQYSLDCFY